jgi:hypothetical protein
MSSSGLNALFEEIYQWIVDPIDKLLVEWKHHKFCE